MKILNRLRTAIKKQTNSMVMTKRERLLRAINDPISKRYGSRFKD